MKFEWIPNTKIGDFYFGEQIEKYIIEFQLYEIEEEFTESVGWDVYGMNETDIRIYVEDNKIVSVGCFEEFVYKNKNLIGCSIKEVIDIFDSAPNDDIDIIYIDDEPQQVYELEDPMAQVWAKNGIVVSIFSGLEISDEE